MPDSLIDRGPVIDYLLKEVSFSTCDNKFFGELEKEMLIPNNLNIHGRIKGATNLKDYKLRLEFPDETVIAYLKQPVSNKVEEKKRVLTYNLEELINYDDYWWLPLERETEFSLALNLLPPFPQLNPVDLQIACRPDVAVGIEAHVTTTVQIEAEEPVDNLFLTMSTPPFYSPGVSLTITEFSGDTVTEPRQSVTSPNKEFPFPRLGLKRGERREYKINTRISADTTSMTALKCQQDLLKTRLVLLTKSIPSGPPCGVSVHDSQGRVVPVERTIRSTILQALAQIMYSPFSIRREAPEGRKVPAEALAR
jgi:hypothetical protein